MDLNQPSDSCELCKHSNDMHVLVSFQEQPVSGIRLCPVMKCQCFGTWALSDIPRESVTVPPDEEIVALRNRIQADAVKKA